MKILMTGLTARHAGKYSAGTLRYCQSAPLNVLALRDMGHEVDWRFVVPGEDTSGYDLLWVNAQPANALSARVAAAPGAFWCLAQHQPTVVWTDDWAIDRLWGSFRAVGAKFEKQCNKVPGDGDWWYRLDPAIIAPHYAVISAAMLEFGHPWTRWILASPMFQWGDRDLFFSKDSCVPRDRWLSVDPSPQMLCDRAFIREASVGAGRNRVWTMASLVDHSDWLKRKKWSWPVHVYSNDRTLKREGIAVLLKGEDKVMEKYRENWGVLAPNYYHAGSGWWRARYVMAVQAGAVLYCEPEEGRHIGEPYTTTISGIEGRFTVDLWELAHQQRECLSGQFATLAQYHQQLTDVLQLALVKS